MDAWTHGRMDTWTHGRMDAWTHGRIHNEKKQTKQSKAHMCTVQSVGTTMAVPTSNGEVKIVLGAWNERDPS